MIGFLGSGRHKRVRALLSAYVDGEVSEEETREVERHLSSCELCQSELEDLRATVGWLRRLPDLELPRSFALTPEQVVTQRPTVPYAWALRLATSAAALLLIGLLLADVLGAGIKRSSPGAAIESAATVEVEKAVEKEVVREVPVEKIVEAERAGEKGAEAPAATEKAAGVQVEKLLVATTSPVPEAVPGERGAQPKRESDVAVEKAVVATSTAEVAAALESSGARSAKAGETGAVAESTEPRRPLTPERMQIATTVATPPVPPETEDTVVSAEPAVEEVAAEPSRVQRAPATVRPAPELEPAAIKLSPRRAWPLRQLELAAAAAFGVLLLLSVWTRRRRSSDRSA